MSPKIKELLNSVVWQGFVHTPKEYPMKTFRSFGMVLALLIFGTSLFGQGASVWHGSTVNNDYINSRWAELANTFEADLPIPRMALYDIGYPRGAAEFERLDGYGLLLVSAMSQEKSYLPVARVFVTVDGKDIELTRINSFLAEAKDANNTIAKGFGRYRMDAIYAFPVWLRFQPGVLKVEFKGDTQALVLNRFSSEMSDVVRVLPNRKPKGNSYPAAALDQFMKREYPGYFGN
jgi:hypothetical protein